MHRPFRFATPVAPPAALIRSRLLEVLDRRFDLRLITIEAGAGLGKTTLLTHALDANRRDDRGIDCWLTCEPADASVSTFAAALLQAVGGPTTDAAPRVEEVCEAVWARAPQQVCLVLDDAHNVDAASPGADVFRQLVDHLPDNGHLVVAARRLPPVPRSRLVVQGRAVELDQASLLLDDQEEAAFAATHRVSVDLVHAAGGWPALAELYCRTGSTHARQFIWEEVVSRLSADDRRAFLLIVAVGGADAEAIKRVTDASVDARVLAELPLVSVDEHGGVWPHPLWRELLDRRIDGQEAVEARRRLATALLEHGDNAQSFELLAQTEDWEHALPVLFEACNDQRQPPWLDQMQRWRRLVPSDVDAQPEAVYLDAMIERAADPWSSRGQELFRAAMLGFRSRGDIRSEVSTGVRGNYAAWLRCDRSTLDETRARIQELIAAGLPLDPLLVTNEMVVADIEGRSGAIRERLPRVGELEPRLRHFPPIVSVFAALADGDADSAETAAADAAVAAMPVVPAAMTGWALLAPALVAWARGDMDAARSESLVDPGPRFIVAERVPTLTLAAVMAAHLGDRDEAVRLSSQIDQLVPEVGERQLLAGFRAVAGAAAAVAAGDEEGARLRLAIELDGRPLDPAGAGRAIRWFPTLPYLFHEGARELLDALDSGPSRTRTLDACRALLAARAGVSQDRSALPEEPDALACALPTSLATELVVRTAGASPSAAHVGYIAGLVDLAPSAVRASLRRLEAARDEAVKHAAHTLLATVPIPPPARVRVEVFGATRLLHDGVEVDSADWRRQRVRQLVCVLAAYREIRRDRLGALLWPDNDEKSVSANLRMTLSYVQGLLEPHRARGDAPWFLQQRAGVLSLRVEEHLTVDAWDFEAALDAADAAAMTPALELEHLLRAVTLWRGEYIDDVAGEEWAEPLRTRARQQFVRAGVRAGDLLLAGGRSQDALSLAERVLHTDPWCEAAMRLQVGAQLTLGDHSGAVTALEAGLRALAELGVAPEPATLALRDRLLTRP